MRLIDNLCALCSNLNGSYSGFSVENSVDLRLQENYCHLNYITDHSFRGDTLRFLKQKSDGWFIARSEATVTGSTLNSALGLDSLKSQQEHYDCNILGKDRQEPSSQIKEKMKYGTENELHAVAKLVSKVLPVFFPTLIYSEVSCIKKAQNGVSFVISPDGLCENSMTDHDSAKNFAVEIKCPYPATPGTYKLPVYYSIPRYYIPQILSEMFALNVENLIFACYSKESTVVMIAKFDSDLWSMVQREIEKVYQRRSRPVKKSEGVPALKRRTELYIERNVKFLGEFQSVKGTECTGRTSIIDDPYCTHQNTMIGSQNRIVSELKEALVESTNVFKTAYQLNRTKASELLGFIISDLDRMSSPGQIQAVPFAFGLKGYSLPTDILRSMLEHVISECTKAGLCSSLEELKEVVDIEVKSSSGITVGKKKSDDSIHASYRIVKMINDWKEGKYRQEQKKNKSKDINSSETDILSTLPVNVVENLPEEILDEVLTNEDESSSGIPVGLPTDSLDGIGVALRVAEDMASNGRTDNESEMSERRPSNQVETKLNLTRNDCVSMLEVLRTSKSKKTWDMSAESFCQLFTNAETKEELVAVIRPIMTKLNQHTQESDLRIRLSENKHQIVSKLSRILGDGSIQASPARKLKKSPSKLSFITKAVLRKIPKEIISSLYSENIFPERAKEWYGKSPFGEEIRIKGLTGTGNWYSMPEYNVSTGNYLLMILDSYHQICGARRLVCQNGIPLKGVKREAFAKVALESESNGCQLSMAMVNDLIDKQNIAFACATFSEQVADALESIGEYSTAEFCRLIDMWYRADDDPGLSALDRCKYRLQLKEWLLDGISFYEFPPPGAYIKGIPVVLFEGLLTNIQRKIQLYAFYKSGTYNVRSVGSLDIENFFGTFQDLDPKGTGVLRPDDIPAAISVSVELLDGKLDPNRGFEMETSRAKVYPTKKILTTSNSVCIDRKVSEGIRRDFKSIEAIDHAFDLPERARRKPKRKCATVSKPDEPAKGCHPVRKFHKRDESKILPHVRRGLSISDI
ncbi:hypothetical protein FSP39_024263 [Pinctada imbricata]|uniref:YqaJ viral recombinase domain-containing protein n=1 Tax=Pinctada imbricata TaxID=66713 RepID=A0AA89BWH0_PINIB|nr:hypothetical protein FSP39_024263 [Pinctada imbricata]